MGIKSDVEAYEFHARAVGALERIAGCLEFFVEQSHAHAEAASQPQTVHGACPQCGAPEDKQADAGTLVNPGLKQCLICSHEYQ